MLTSTDWRLLSDTILGGGKGGGGHMVPALCHMHCTILDWHPLPKRRSQLHVSFSRGDCWSLSPAPVTGGTSSFFTSLNFISRVSGVFPGMVLCHFSNDKSSLVQLMSQRSSVILEQKMCLFLTYLGFRGQINSLKLLVFL